AKAGIDYARRCGVRSHARNSQARRPRCTIEQIGRSCAATTVHTHRLDASIPVDARDADAIVRRSGDDAGDKGAVPIAVLRIAKRRGTEAVGASVARVTGIGIASVVIVGARKSGYAVVPRVASPGQLGIDTPAG